MSEERWIKHWHTSEALVTWSESTFSLLSLNKTESESGPIVRSRLIAEFSLSPHQQPLKLVKQ